MSDASKSWDGIDRRDSNVILFRLGQVEDRVEGVHTAITAHVDECAKLHKRVFLVGVGILFLLIIEYPAVGTFLKGAIDTITGWF